MNRSTVSNRVHQDLIEDLLAQWRRDPDAVDASWRHFFEGYELGLTKDGPSAGHTNGQVATAHQLALPDVGTTETAQSQASVTRLVDAYREIGHYLADLDPLQLATRRQSHELLELSEFGLTDDDLERSFYTKLFDPPNATLNQIIGTLREIYCGSVGVEYMHIRDRKIRLWLQERMEPLRNRPQFDLKRKRKILWKLNAASLFETFLSSHYVGQKRFSLEGGEMLIPLLDMIIDKACSFGVQDIVFGMPHRGRLNVLANILNKPYRLIFHEFEGNMPKTVAGDGDVKYHLGFSADHVTADGHSVHLSLTANPSHLEAVNPVVEGRMRAKQRQFPSGERKLGLPILIHGDAAFAGQGLVAETLNLSQLPGYKTGGTIHIVVNNQIGFTTVPSDGRSSRYCTDVAKMIEVPIFHVNGDDAEAVVYVGQLAAEFRQEFGQDVVIDLVCYRKHGHNEGDEPGFTQPVMYEAIRKKKPVRDIYTQKLIDSGDLTIEEAATLAETFEEKLEGVYREVHESGELPDEVQPGFQGPWEGLNASYDWETVETVVSAERLALITEALAAVPDGFTRNRKLDRILGSRVQAVADGGPIDWAFAEALAFGSLLLEGTSVRLSGQDSRRGTFSQRHAAWVDSQTGSRYYPLRHLAPDQADCSIFDSMLSEAAVLGFDYGYSLDAPDALVCWEAQFGDFVNGAQVIIDQFICSAESKWGRGSGIVLLLPHGYDGQGPEHSSARLERFLQLSAEENIQVVNCTTPAQYFHLLRRQVRRKFRKPLVVMTPKSLLRNKQCVSRIEEFTHGHFNEIIGDSVADPKSVRRIVLSSGKLYYDLLNRRASASKENEVALIRVEQLYPFAQRMLKEEIDKYDDSVELVWAQEESQNMGAWSFVEPRLRDLTGRHFKYVGRDASASPATGSHAVHEREQLELVESAIGAPVPHLV